MNHGCKRGIFAPTAMLISLFSSPSSVGFAQPLTQPDETAGPATDDQFTLAARCRVPRHRACHEDFHRLDDMSDGFTRGHRIMTGEVVENSIEVPDRFRVTNQARHRRL